jgi:hypothetical protein
LTDLSLEPAFGPGFTADLVPIVQVLHRLPLARLCLDFYKYTDESIESLLSFLSQSSSVQELKLGSPSPKQVLLIAAALPSLSSLQCLEFDTRKDSELECEFDSTAHLALFSALPSSSLRSFALSFAYFFLDTFETCLDKLAETSQLTRCRLQCLTVFPDRERPKGFSRRTTANLKKLRLDWTDRFPLLKDRFCCISWSERRW